MKVPFFFLFLVMSVTLSCGHEEATPPLLTQLRDKYEKELNRLKQLSDGHIAGWPSDHDCDGALWAGIARAAGATWVQVEAALQQGGRPMRKPFRDCVTPDESATTTSNDMITGILLGLQAANDLASILRLYGYGEEHSWIMGTPEEYISRVLLRPNGITLMARIIYQLSGGKRDYSVRLLPVLYGPVSADYERHLILLSRIIEKRAGGPQYGAELAEQLLAKSETLDALAQAVAGNTTAAAYLLMSPEYKAPTYVRGHDNYAIAHWLLAAKVTLDKVSSPW